MKFLSYSRHENWQIHEGFIIATLSYWAARAAEQAASWFLPPTVSLGDEVTLPSNFGNIMNHRIVFKGLMEGKDPNVILEHVWWIWMKTFNEGSQNILCFDSLLTSKVSEL